MEPVDEAGTPIYGTQFDEAPLADSYTVVLTAQPGAGCAPPVKTGIIHFNDGHFEVEPRRFFKGLA